jgi:hypothetical protein
MLAACDSFTELDTPGMGELVRANLNSRRVTVIKTKASKNQVIKLELSVVICDCRLSFLNSSRAYIAFAGLKCA